MPSFNSEALTRAIKTDQAGESTFPESLNSTWKAGVVRYEVDFLAREAIDYGCSGEQHVENYPEVNVECGLIGVR